MTIQVINANDKIDTTENPAKDTSAPLAGWGTDGAKQEAPAPATPAQVTAVKATPPAADMPVAYEAPAENKEQLRRRVECRLAELAASQAQLAGHDGNPERAQAIETEIQVARGAMGGGWEHVGQMEAAQLAQWLTKSESLILPTPAEIPAAQDQA